MRISSLFLNTDPPPPLHFPFWKKGKCSLLIFLEGSPNFVDHYLWNHKVVDKIVLRKVVLISVGTDRENIYILYTSAISPSLGVADNKTRQNKKKKK